MQFQNCKSISKRSHSTPGKAEKPLLLRKPKTNQSPSAFLWFFVYVHVYEPALEKANCIGVRAGLVLVSGSMLDSIRGAKKHVGIGPRRKPVQLAWGRRSSASGAKKHVGIGPRRNPGRLAWGPPGAPWRQFTC